MTLSSSLYDVGGGEISCGRNLNQNRCRRSLVDAYARACACVVDNAFWREARRPPNPAMGAEGPGPHAALQVGLEGEEETWKEPILTSTTGIALLAQ